MKNNNVILLLVCLALVLLLGALPCPAQNWTLYWNDEFNGPSGSKPDPKNWTMWDAHSNINNELEYYTPEDVYIDGNGSLVIRQRKNVNLPGHGFEQYTSGKVTSWEGNQLWYVTPPAKVEIRAQMPVMGKGLWPGLWLNACDSWPPEIDILEMVNDPTKVYMTWHYGGGGGAGGGGTYTGPDYSTGFHTFGVEWMTDAIRWYIDGVQRAIVTSPSNITGILNREYMILNVGVGGDWPGSPDASTVFPQYMLVDYVRIYKPGAAKDSAYCQSGIKVDGVLNEGAWAGARKQIAKVVSGDADGVTAEFKTCFDNNYLYVAADVKDSKLYNQATNIWENSSVEIFLDMNHGRTTTYESNDFQYITVWNKAQPYEENGRITNVLTASANTSSGYSVEMAIPWSTLGVTPAQGALYGFDAGVNINHDNGARTGHLMWNGTETNSSNTSQFGDLVLNNVCAATLASELNSDPSIRIYPNPLGSGILNIDVPGHANADAMVTLTDISGRIIYTDKLVTNSSGHTTLPAGTIAGNGLYFLSIKTSDGIKNFKLTIDK